MTRNSPAARLDLLALASVALVSLLWLALHEETPLCAAEPAASVPAPVIAEEDLPAPGDAPAEWVLERKAVPDWALYPYVEDEARRAPAPDHDLKQQTWHNRLLFPTKACPYCGRRVPTPKGSYLFLAIGFVGQLFFASRFLVQWIASEKAKASVIPVSFWWISILGSALVLVYAIDLRAWPIILGQIPGFFIYARNLHLLDRSRRAETPDGEAP